MINSIQQLQCGLLSQRLRHQGTKGAYGEYGYGVGKVGIKLVDEDEAGKSDCRKLDTYKDQD